MRFVNVNLPRYAFVLAASLFASGFGCSVGLDGEDLEEIESDASELATLPAASIIGDVQFGDSFRKVDYDKTPRYRALRFDGTAGDTIKVRIRSNTAGRRSIGWLLDANFRTIMHVEGDAVTRTTDTYFEATLTETATYYVALREASLKDASFEVQVRRIRSASADPFDPASCDGDPLDSNELRELLGTTQERTLGRYEIQYRERSCTASGCTAWTSGVAPERSNCSGVSGSYRFPGCKLPGDLKLVYGSSGFQVTLGYTPTGNHSGADNHLGSLCTFEPNGQLACNAYGFRYYVDRSAYCRLHACNGPAYNHTFLELGERTAGQRRESRQPMLRGALKNGCFQATATVGGELGQSSWMETQAAILVRF